MNTAMLIVNPISGTADKEAATASAAGVLVNAGWAVEPAFTRAPGHATELAREAVRRGLTAVVVIGGDGTVNEAASGLCGQHDTALGIIPCGSGNGLARHLHLPMNAMAAAAVVTSGTRCRLDYGTVNGRPFFCTFGLGFDAAVSDAFAQARRRGPLSYLAATLATYAHYRPLHYDIDTAEGEHISTDAFLVSVCNASQYGNNAFIAPAASMCDGLLDITIVESGNLPETALVGIDLMTKRLEHNPLVRCLRTHALTIERPTPGLAHIDGEPVEMEARLHLAVTPQAFTVMVAAEEDVV